MKVRIPYKTMAEAQAFYDGLSYALEYRILDIYGVEITKISEEEFEVSFDDYAGG